MGKMMQVNRQHPGYLTLARWGMIVRDVMLRTVMLGVPSASLSWAIAGGSSGDLLPLKGLAATKHHLSQPTVSQPTVSEVSELTDFSLDNLPTTHITGNSVESRLDSCPPRRTKAELDRLLELRNTNPSEAAAIDQQIHHLFGETHAVMVLDMSGFSLRTLKLGIIPTLAVIKRLQTEIVPIITAHQGTVVKLEADNVFAVFPDAQDAVEGAIAIHQHLLGTELRVSIGIGYGEMLMLAEEDMFGTELNLASKLGEDLAEPGATMITETAFQRLGSRNLTGQSTPATAWQKSEIAISGVRMLAYTLKAAVSQSK